MYAKAHYKGSSCSLELCVALWNVDRVNMQN